MLKLSNVLSAVVVLLSLISNAGEVPAPAKTRVLIFTGGHGFEKEPFFKLFQDNPDITFRSLEHPNAYPALKSDAAKLWDVLVLYDLQQTIPEPAQQDLVARL